MSEFMINSYCDSLKDTFAQLVYYGILKEEDAQCFSVESSIEGGSFLLAGGSVLLALLNTFVIKAVVQYFRDKDEVDKRTLEEKQASRMSLDTSNTEVEDEADGGFSARIHPAPVLFTDTFRWALRQDNRLASSSRAIFGNADNQWELPEATVVLCDGRGIDPETIEGQYVNETGIEDSKLGSHSSASKASRVSYHNIEDSKMSSPNSVSRASRTSSGSFSAKGRRLSYGEDEKCSSSGSFTDGSLSGRQSFRSGTAFAKKGAPKEDQESISSQPSAKGDQSVSVQSSFRDETAISTASVARSSAVSKARSSADSSAKAWSETYEEETLDDEQTEYEVVEEEYNDAHSEYVEETVDDFEEYTVTTMSDIEEDYFEDNSDFDEQSGPRPLT